MKELEKKLKKLLADGYETILISQVIEWIYNIKRDSKAKKLDKYE
jgi:hypothetical protein